MNPDWNELVSESYYETISTIQEKLKQYEVDEALVGLDYLYQNMANRDKREFLSFLTLAMMHVLKWKHQPEKRAKSWSKTIQNARDEMEILREDVPSITQEYIEKTWENAFKRAVKRANFEMKLDKKEDFYPASLTWKDVFDDEYLL
ncbi:MAG: DUF29 domain-containing protein [Cytophagaceae bacterium]|nr:DUF29 domain-containing protein [Cytophagaceae bacterium]